jgi:DNA-binding MurR/RpiR family transcriptional regulator
VGEYVSMQLLSHHADLSKMTVVRLTQKWGKSSCVNTVVRH